MMETIGHVFEHYIETPRCNIFFLYEHVESINSLDIVLKEKKKVIKDLLYFNEF